MLSDVQIFARRNDALNQWLGQNPIVFAGLFMGIGGLLLYFGVRDLRRGVTRDKRGREVSGGMATLISVVRIIGGVVAAGFGLSRLVMG